MASRLIQNCIKEVQEKYLPFASDMNSAGLLFMITCTARDLWEQGILMMQGRTNLTTLNKIRASYEMPNLMQEEDHKVTWTWLSKHIVLKDIAKAEKVLALCRQNGIVIPENLILKVSGFEYSRAIDIALMKGVKQPHWNLKISVDGDQIPDYEEMAVIAEKNGFKAGMRFKTFRNGVWVPTPDAPHIEI